MQKKAIQSARFASASVYPADPWLKLEQDSEQTRQWTQQQNRRTSQWFDRHAASLFAQCSVSQPDDSYSCVSEIEDSFIARKLYGDETCAVSGWILIFTKRKCWWIPRWYRDSSTTLFLPRPIRRFWQSTRRTRNRKSRSFFWWTPTNKRF